MLLLKVPVQPAGTPTAIRRRSEGQGTQRIAGRGNESFEMVSTATERDEVLSIDKIQADESPIIRLVDSTLFDA